MVGVGAGVKCFKDLPVGAKSVLFSMMWPTSFLIIISGFLHPSEIQKSHCSIFLRVLWANLRKDSRPNYPRRPRPPIAPSSHFISPWHNRSNSESTVITDMGESKTALTEWILCLIKTWIVLLLEVWEATHCSFTSYQQIKPLKHLSLPTWPGVARLVYSWIVVDKSKVQMIPRAYVVITCEKIPQIY